MVTSVIQINKRKKNTNQITHNHSEIAILTPWGYSKALSGKKIQSTADMEKYKFH